MDINTRIAIDKFDLARAGLPTGELTNWNNTIPEYIKGLDNEDLITFVELVYKLAYNQGGQDMMLEEE
jgi:hypothetical protein